jgi:hypothetical protein
MAWGRSAPSTRATELERLAGQAEAAFLAMPPEQQAAALGALETITKAAGDLKAIPEALVDVLGKIVIKFLLELYVVPLRRPPPEKLVRQLLNGAPTLLGPHRTRIEEMLRAG